MDHQELSQLLPHRKPMLLVDDVTLQGDSAVAHYMVHGYEWYLQGHFPECRQVPNSFLCEIMGQSSCVLIGDNREEKFPLLTGIDNAHFYRAIEPPAELEVRVNISSRKGPLVVIDAVMNCNGEMCASAQLSYFLSPRSF